MKPMFLKTIISFVVLVVMVLSFFWVDITSKFAAASAGLFSDTVGLGAFTPEQSGRIIGFRLVTGENDLSQIRIQNMRSGQPVNGLIDVYFDLVNLGAGNQFPSLRVFLMNSQGKTVRTIEFAPPKYQHGSSFGTEPVALTLRIEPDESKFTVSAFYAD